MKDISYIDVTQDWIDNASPNSHEVLDAQYYVTNDGKKYYVDDKNVVLDYSETEKEVAKWLESIFGGELYMVPRVNNPEGIMTSDYLFRGEYWDLKEIFGNGKYTLDSAVKKKKCQARNFIFDISNSEISLENVYKQIEKIYKSKDRKWINIIMVKRNDMLILIYKRK